MFHFSFKSINSAKFPVSSFFLVIFINIFLLSIHNGYFCIMVSKQEIEQRLCKTEKPCLHYSKCEIDKSSFYPKCVCNNECDISDFRLAIRQSTKFSNISEKDLPSKLSEPICGTDGENYLNFCELKKSSCKLKKDLGIYVNSIIFLNI